MAAVAPSTAGASQNGLSALPAQAASARSRPVVRTSSSTNARQTEDEAAKRDAELLTKPLFTNSMPDVPMPPYSINVFPDLHALTQYNPQGSTLERLRVRELVLDSDLGFDIDLVGELFAGMSYQLDPNDDGVWKDELLMNDEEDTKTDRSSKHKSQVTFMRKIDYGVSATTSTSTTAFNKMTLMDATKKQRIVNLYETRRKRIEYVKQTFVAARKVDALDPATMQKAHKRLGVRPVASYSVFPDFRNWPYHFAQVLFDIDPAPPKTEYAGKDEIMSNSQLRRVGSDNSRNDYVIYFTPTQETLEKRREDKAKYMSALEARQAKQDAVANGEMPVTTTKPENLTSADGEKTLDGADKKTDVGDDDEDDVPMKYDPNYTYEYNSFREYAWTVVNEGAEAHHRWALLPSAANSREQTFAFRKSPEEKRFLYIIPGIKVKMQRHRQFVAGGAAGGSLPVRYLMATRHRPLNEPEQTLMLSRMEDLRRAEILPEPEPPAPPPVPSMQQQPTGAAANMRQPKEESGDSADESSAASTTDDEDEGVKTRTRRNKVGGRPPMRRVNDDDDIDSDVRQKSPAVQQQKRPKSLNTSPEDEVKGGRLEKKAKPDSDARAARTEAAASSGSSSGDSDSSSGSGSSSSGSSSSSDGESSSSEDARK